MANSDIAVGTLTYTDIFGDALFGANSNNLVPNGDFSSGTSEFVSGADNAENVTSIGGGLITFTSDSSGDLGTTLNVPIIEEDHYYYYSFEGAFIYELDFYGFLTQPTETQGALGKASDIEQSDQTTFGVDITPVEGATLHTFGNLMVFDLTDIFGSGSEPDVTTFETYMATFIANKAEADAAEAEALAAQDFKKSLYEKVVEVLNLTTQDVLFDGGYEYVVYNGIPYVIDQSTTEVFDYARSEVITVSEEYNQETPSVNATDRSDYVTQYQVMARLQQLSKLKTALNEFRTYFFANKQFTIDDYTVGIKTVRGNKQQSVMVEGGNVYVRYTIDVYCTATKYGYITKDTDIWKMRKTNEVTTALNMVENREYEILTVGTTNFIELGAISNTVGVTFTYNGSLATGTGTVQDSYKTLKVIEDATSTQGNPIFSNALEIGKGFNTITTLSSQLRVAYESDYFTKHLYSFAMNDEDKDQIYDIVHTFDGENFSYTGILVSVTRRNAVGGTVILEINWTENDA